MHKGKAILRSLVEDSKTARRWRYGQLLTRWSHTPPCVATIELPFSPSPWRNKSETQELAPQVNTVTALLQYELYITCPRLQMVL